MASTLKQGNQLPLTAILASTVIALVGIQYGVDQVVGQLKI